MNPFLPLLATAVGIITIGIMAVGLKTSEPKIKLTDEVFRKLRTAAENHQFNKANRTRKQKDLDARIHEQLDREILDPEECAKLAREL